jgi:magnesium-transporting ATPase (P-type)
LDHDLENEEALRRVVLFLATCHTIVIDQKKGTYNSASPDELALVNAAKQFGYEFYERDEFDNIVVRHNKSGELFKYKLLNVCEFTSTRKRMSCIYRDPQDRIVLMCKGADAIIKERLSSESLNSEIFDKTQVYVDDYANEGLRTLFLAEKFIDPEVYREWLKESNIAKLEINDREEKVAAVDEKIEVDLELIGSTAIEDRL